MARKPATDTLNIRGIDATDAEHIRRSAAARGLTLGQYLGALRRLHDAMRARADAGDAKVGAELSALGLETVTR